MQIKTGYGSEEKTTVSVEKYVENTLNGSMHGDGRLEAAERTAENACRAIGRLLDWAAERDMISARELAHIVNEYGISERVTVEFISEKEAPIG